MKINVREEATQHSNAVVEIRDPYLNGLDMCGEDMVLAQHDALVGMTTESGLWYISIDPQMCD